MTSELTKPRPLSDWSGPWLLWRGADLWLVGSGPWGKSTLFEILEAPGGRTIGVVEVVEQGAQNAQQTRVIWHCWGQLESGGQVTDWLPAERVDRSSLDVGKCRGSFYKNPGPRDGQKPSVTVNLGENQKVVPRDQFELASDHGDVLGDCRVVDVAPTSSICELDGTGTSLSAPTGTAHIRTLPPEPDELRRWIVPYRGTWPLHAATHPNPQHGDSARAEPPPAPPDRAPSLGVDQWLGIACWGVGTIGLGAGTFMALNAKSDYSAAKKLCAPEGCGDDPYEEIQSAQRRGWAATGIIAGSVLAAGAGFYFWFARPFAPSGAGQAARSSMLGLGCLGDQVVVRGSF